MECKLYSNIASPNSTEEAPKNIGKLLRNVLNIKHYTS